MMGSGASIARLDDSKEQIIDLLMKTTETLICEQYDNHNDIHRLQQDKDGLECRMTTLFNENWYLINQLNYLINENNALRGFSNNIFNLNHPENMYPQQIDVQKQEEQSKLLLITTFNGITITEPKRINKIFEFINNKIDVNCKDCEVDSNKINYIGGNKMMSLFNMIFPNKKSIKALNVAKKGLLNQEIEEKEYQRQMTLATLVFSNEKILVITASAVSRAYLYVHFSDMIQICGKCTCCWIWDEKLQEYQFWDSNCQSEIDYLTHQKQGCPGFKPKYFEKAN